MFTLKLSDSNKVQIDSNYSIQNQELYANLVGRALVIQRPEENGQKIFFAQVVPKQPDSCLKVLYSITSVKF